MDVNWGIVALAICGFAFFFMVLGIFFFNQYRRLIRNMFMFSIINKVIDTSKEDIASQGEDEPAPDVKHVSRAEIRARASTVDFDSAVAKYKTPVPPVQAQQAAPPPPTFEAEDAEEDSRPLRPPTHLEPPKPRRRTGNYPKQQDDIYDD